MKPFLAAVILAVLVSVPSAQTADSHIGLLVKPGTGDDSRSRLALRRLTNTGFRPGAEAERASHEGSLVKGLADRSEWEVKSFLIDELALQGKTAAVSPVAGYLADPNLCEPAAMALQMIASTEGADKVLPAARTALAPSTGKCRVAVVNALGTLRDPDPATVDALVRDAVAPDRHLRTVALRALAAIGDAKAKAPLAEALKAVDLYERNRAVSLNLLLALRMAERGNKAEGAALANGIRTLGASESKTHVVSSADTTLARIGRTTGLAAAPRRKDLPSNRRGVLITLTHDGGYALKGVDLRGREIPIPGRKP